MASKTNTNKFSIQKTKTSASMKEAKSKEIAKCKSKTESSLATSQSGADDVLTRMAIEEICRETAKGALRAEQIGPSGWLPCPLMKTNKRFLRNTIKSVISHNTNRNVKPKKSEKELDEIIKGGQRRKPKFGERRHCFRKPVEKLDDKR